MPERRESTRGSATAERRRDGHRRINPIQVQKYLKGVNYPVKKAQIVENARKQGADEEILSALKKLPDQEYNSPVAVSKAIGQIE